MLIFITFLSELQFLELSPTNLGEFSSTNFEIKRLLSILQKILKMPEQICDLK